MISVLYSYVCYVQNYFVTFVNIFYLFVYAGERVCTVAGLNSPFVRILNKQFQFQFLSLSLSLFLPLSLKGIQRKTKKKDVVNRHLR